MAVDTERSQDLDDLMARLEEGDNRYRYSVAWVDCLARGKRLGRGVLTRGDHAPPELLPVRHRNTPFAVSTATKLRVPVTAPRGLLNPVSVAAFNEAWFRRAPKLERGRPQPYPAFFHPLDGLAEWNRLYGPSGFVQYQFVVGPDRGDVVRSAIERLAAGRVASFLAVLKRFGPPNPGPLSFPQPGWTLALDMPVGPTGLERLLDDLDETVAEAGGRVYLAKDARLRPELVSVMYPRASQLNEVRRRVDPGGVLCSDLACRLGLATRHRLRYSPAGVGSARVES
jgi:decaprenylphospho-beta-D-ribofuranose 2-oxidase